MTLKWYNKCSVMTSTIIYCTRVLTVLSLTSELLNSKMSAALWKPSKTHIYVYLSANWNTRPHTRIFLLVCILYSQRLTWEHQCLSHDFTIWLHTFLVRHCWFGVVEVMYLPPSLLTRPSTLVACSPNSARISHCKRGMRKAWEWG